MCGDVMSRESSIAPVHIFWIGPPAGHHIGVVHGQDIMGVTEMPAEIPITFWCLDEHSQHYTDRLADHANVVVRGAQQYLLECLESGDAVDISLIERITPLIDKLLTPVSRNSVRDRVTIKVLIQYFIAYQLGGYVMDSNITPLPGRTPEFKHADHVRFPAYKTVVKRAEHMDMWMIYSPTKHPRMLASLQLFIDKIQSIESSRSLLSGSKRYHMACGAAVTTSILLMNTRYDRPILTDCLPWYAIPDDGKVCVTVDEISVQKFYFNTHKHETVLNEVFCLVQQGRIFELGKLLDYGEPVEQSLPCRGWDKLSLLLHAVISNNAEIVSLLLRRGADPSRICTYLDTAYDAMGLASAYHYDACADVIREHCRLRDEGMELESKTTPIHDESPGEDSPATCATAAAAEASGSGSTQLSRSRLFTIAATSSPEAIVIKDKPAKTPLLMQAMESMH